MKIAVDIQPADASPAESSTRGMRTPTFCRRSSPRTSGDGMSGSVGLEGRDGSWLILDVAAGRINGVEVAVWPDVRKLPRSSLPTTDRGRARRRSVAQDRSRTSRRWRSTTRLDRRSGSRPAKLSFPARQAARRAHRAARAATCLLDVDDKSQISGLWLLNVPPCPRVDRRDHDHRSHSRRSDAHSDGGEHARRRRGRDRGVFGLGRLGSRRDRARAGVRPDRARGDRDLSDGARDSATQTLTAFRAYSKKDLQQAWDIGVE